MFRIQGSGFRICLVACGAAWLLRLPAFAAPAGVTLVANGIAPCPLFAPAQAAEAAGDLARYLERMSGARFTVQISPERPSVAPAIGVGYPDARAATLRNDGYVLRATPQGLDIAAATPLGLRFGVFGFLEDHLGCRWWSLNEEDGPKTPTIELAPLDAVVQPAFRQMLLMNQEAESRTDGFVFKGRAASTEQWSGSHTLYPLLTPYAKTHPEIYPLERKTGKRAPNKIHFCYSAPGLAEALADALAQEVRQHGGNVRDIIYMAGMGDSYGGECECARCQAIYLEEGWTGTNGVRRGLIGGTNLRMINRTAEILDARFPGIKVGTMAYMSMEAPPTVTVPRSNVAIRIPHLRHCIIHSSESCPRNAQYVANLRKWGQLAPGRVHVWDYTVNFGDNFLYPTPVLNAIADNIRFYARSGVGGLILQGNYVSTGSDLVVLKNYVWRRLFWDPSLRTDDLVREFCDGYYGPASAPLQAYVKELEDAAAACATNGAHLDEFAERPEIAKAYLGRERLARLRATADEARRLAAGREPFARRVEEAVVSLDAFSLWHPGPLAEQDGRLVRTDLTNLVAGGWTFDRALKVCEFSRKASPREWGAYAHYQELFLASHGGPLATLARGDLRVTVAPAIDLRIRQIAFKGRPLLAVPDNPDEAGWPHLGGASEQVFPSWTYGKVAGERSTTAVTMDADAVSGSSIKHQATKRVELTEAGAIRITAASRRLSKLPGYDHTSAQCHTEYALGKDASGFRVETLSTGGVWTAITLSPTNPPPPKTKGKKDKRVRHGLAGELPAGLTAVRVALTDAGCVVEDRYEAPAVRGGSVLAANGVLTVTVRTVGAPVAFDAKTPWLEHTLRVDPAPVPANGGNTSP